MQLLLVHDLPFVSVQIDYRDAMLDIPHILLDTGSATTLLSADIAEKVGITPHPDDRLRNVYGVGGIETVFMRRLDSIQVEGSSLRSFVVDIGGMDYVRDVNGILGMDFLLKTGAVIDLAHRTVEFQEMD